MSIRTSLIWSPSISPCLGGVAQSVRNQAPLPGPSVTWLKAQLEQQHLMEARRLRQAIVRRAFRLAGVWAALMVLVLWIRPAIASVLAGLRSTPLEMLVAYGIAGIVPLLLLRIARINRSGSAKLPS